MKPFAFKVWDKQNSCWVQDELEALGKEFGLTWIDMDGCAIDYEGCLSLMDQCGGDAALDPERFIFVEWTGILDRKGRKIFDYDVVAIYHTEREEERQYEGIGGVRWLWGGFYTQISRGCAGIAPRIGLRPLDDWDTEYEVLGSILEHSDEPNVLDLDPEVFKAGVYRRLEEGPLAWNRKEKRHAV